MCAAHASSRCRLVRSQLTLLRTHFHLADKEEGPKKYLTKKQREEKKAQREISKK